MLKRQNKLAILSLTNLIFLSFVLPSRGNDISSVFYISKNDNDNQIHYGIRLNQNCLPEGSNPVYVYWVRENKTTGNLLSVEEPAYGISSQSVSGENVEVILRFFQNRGIQKPISFKIFKLNNGTCKAQAFARINSSQKQLSNIHIFLKHIFRNPLTGSTIGGTVVNLTLVSPNREEEVISCNSNCRFGI
ncbi:DUF4833 domain-containing protein [Microcoleus sp. N3A4]|uniref:DUF4833 domain-containing protein n=1 Tax=Microcoleus sp. N3A4 TaxID=3055379 RepID=UPI002FD4088A